MAVTSGFFNSLNGDRKYNAEQMTAIFDGLINDGVFSNIGTAFAVNAVGGNGITIGVGRAWFNSTWLYNDAILPMTVRDSEVMLNRIDAVVIEINRTDGVRNGTIRFVNGTPSDVPERPPLVNSDGVYQHPLAYIYRAAGATSVSQADITNMIGTSECPYITGILEVQNIDKIVAQWEAEFDFWFENVKSDLDGDVAANLANRILELEIRFQTLAREKSVYEGLQDSSGDSIQDSSGQNIEGKTYLGGESKVIINPVIPSGGSDGYRVGDILTTTRNNLDENWLLCNGDVIDPSAYPLLAPTLVKYPGRLLGSDTFRDAADIGDQSINGVAYGNGYYVTAGPSTKFSSSSIPSLNVLYTQNPEEGWKCDRYANMGDSDDTRYDVGRVRFINGTFYITARVEREYNGSIELTLFSRSGNPNGAWTSKKFLTIDESGSDNQRLTDIVYLNGMLIACGFADGASRIWYQVGGAGEWKEVAVPIYGIWGIAYGNGYYVACGSASYRNGCIAYAKDINGPWTMVRIPPESTSGDDGANLKAIIYSNGYFIAVGKNAAEEACLCYSKTPDGPWSMSFVASNSELNDIVYDGNCYIMAGLGRTGNWSGIMAYSVDFRGGYTFLSDSGGYLNEGILAIVVGEKHIVTVGRSEIGYQSCYAGYTVSDYGSFKLPLITQDGAYSYIKVKE